MEWMATWHPSHSSILSPRPGSTHTWHVASSMLRGGATEGGSLGGPVAGNPSRARCREAARLAATRWKLVEPLRASRIGGSKAVSALAAPCAAASGGGAAEPPAKHPAGPAVVWTAVRAALGSSVAPLIGPVVGWGAGPAGAPRECPAVVGGADAFVRLAEGLEVVKAAGDGMACGGIGVCMETPWISWRTI